MGDDAVVSPENSSLTSDQVDDKGCSDEGKSLYSAEGVSSIAILDLSCSGPGERRNL